MKFPIQIQFNGRAYVGEVDAEETPDGKCYFSWEKIHRDETGILHALMNVPDAFIQDNNLDVMWVMK